MLRANRTHRAGRHIPALRFYLDKLGRKGKAIFSVLYLASRRLGPVCRSMATVPPKARASNHISQIETRRTLRSHRHEKSQPVAKSTDRKNLPHSPNRLRPMQRAATTPPRPYTAEKAPILHRTRLPPTTDAQTRFFAESRLALFRGRLLGWFLSSHAWRHEPSRGASAARHSIYLCRTSMRGTPTGFAFFNRRAFRKDPCPVCQREKKKGERADDSIPM